MTLDDPAKFALAGNAVFTLVSKKSEARFTYRVSAPKTDMQGQPLEEKPAIRFVSVLTGPDNTSSYQYLGLLKNSLGGWRYEHGKKSRISPFAPSHKAFNWFWANLAKGGVSETVEVHHEGRCGRCGRALTVPSSIQSGFGPECIGKL